RPHRSAVDRIRRVGGRGEADRDTRSSAMEQTGRLDRGGPRLDRPRVDMSEDITGQQAGLLRRAAGMHLTDAQRPDAGAGLQLEAEADGLIAPGLVLASLLRDDGAIRVEELHHRLTAYEEGLRLAQLLARAEPFTRLDEELEESRVVGTTAEVGVQTRRRWL